MTRRCLEAAGVHLHGLCLRVVVLVLLAHHFPDAALVSRHGMALSVRASVLSLPLVICTFCSFELLPLRIIWCWVLVFATVWLTWCPTDSSVRFFLVSIGSFIARASQITLVYVRSLRSLCDSIVSKLQLHFPFLLAAPQAYFPVMPCGLQLAHWFSEARQAWSLSSMGSRICCSPF